MVLVLSACSQILTQRCRQFTLADWYLGLVCVQKLLVFIQKIIYTGQDWSERDILDLGLDGFVSFDCAQSA